MDIYSARINNKNKFFFDIIYINIYIITLMLYKYNKKEILNLTSVRC